LIACNKSELTLYGIENETLQNKDDFLIDTFNLNEEQFNNGKAGANTYVMVSGLAFSLGSSINARSSGYVSVANTPIADPYRMSYSGNAQVQMPGFTSSSEAIAFAQNRPASLMRKVAGGGGSNPVEGASKTNPLENVKFTDKVKAQMKQGDYHSFPESVEGFGANGKVTKITGGDKIVRTKVEIPGSFKGKEGVFEYIIEPDGLTCNHSYLNQINSNGRCNV
jgi:hypothetical protein